MLFQAVMGVKPMTQCTADWHSNRLSFRNMTICFNTYFITFHPESVWNHKQVLMMGSINKPREKNSHRGKSWRLQSDVSETCIFLVFYLVNGVRKKRFRSSVNMDVYSDSISETVSLEKQDELDLVRFQWATLVDFKFKGTYFLPGVSINLVDPIDK